MVKYSSTSESWALVLARLKVGEDFYFLYYRFFKGPFMKKVRLKPGKERVLENRMTIVIFIEIIGGLKIWMAL